MQHILQVRVKNFTITKENYTSILAHSNLTIKH